MTVPPIAELDAARQLGRPWPTVGIARAFVARGSQASVVAGLDPRQVSDGRAVGTIGFVGAYRDDRALAGVIAAAQVWLVKQGALVVRCPVNGTVWHGHRAVVDGFADEGGEPSFPLEPANDRCLPQVLTSMGYTPVHHAASYRVPIAEWVAGAGFAEQRLAARGFTDRPLDLTRLQDELSAVHRVALESFAANWGFSPISAAELGHIYRPLLVLARQGVVRILDDRAGRAVGFFFGYPDPAVLPGREGARFVAKTIAVLPDVSREHPGVGYGLAVSVHRHVLRLGFPIAVHALEGEGAYSQRVSARWGEPMRRYATFEKVIGR